jgi:membrane associated rhomboid family serine protease
MRLSGRKPPLFARPWRQQQRVVLVALIGANTAAFVLQLFLEGYQSGFVSSYLAFSDRGIGDAFSWQFITAIFLHDGPWHFLGNMFVLYVFGRDIESILGQRHFLYLYLTGSIAGEFGHLFLMPANSILFAASGGVAAVLAAYATILPELEWSSLKLFGVPLRLKAKYLAYGAFLLALLLVCIDRGSPVSHSAWVGGCLAGWTYAHLLGFGRTSILQRILRQRRAAAERYNQLTAEQLMAEEIDPLLEKISKHGFQSLSRTERRSLLKARERILQQDAVA